MNELRDPADEAREDLPGTLGAVLYANTRPVEPEAVWAGLVAAMAAGEQPALHALYERAQRPVYTLVLRLVRSREIAEELVLDVFHDSWRNAGRYDPSAGTVLAWIMNQARSRAIDRLRHEGRLKRTDPGAAGAEPPAGFGSGQEAMEADQQSSALREAVGRLRPEEREAIEAAYFGGLTHVEVAERLEQPLGTIKTRIRAGLHKLRDAMAGEGEDL